MDIGVDYGRYFFDIGRLSCSWYWGYWKWGGGTDPWPYLDFGPLVIDFYPEWYR